MPSPPLGWCCFLPPPPPLVGGAALDGFAFPYFFGVVVRLPLDGSVFSFLLFGGAHLWCGALSPLLLRGGAPRALPFWVVQRSPPPLGGAAFSLSLVGGAAVTSFSGMVAPSSRRVAIMASSHLRLLLKGVQKTRTTMKIVEK